MTADAEHSSRADAVHAWLVRWRWPLLAAYVLHIVLTHWYILEFISWDALGHRIPPAVELLQNGKLPDGKYENWALVEFHPWIELTHIPYLAAFGMPGVYFSFGTSLFPFCVYAVWLLARELSNDRVAAFYSAFAYALTPLVSAQIVAGYVDWAVCGLLAFFLYALLALGRLNANSSRRDRTLAGARLVVGTLVFSLARQQAPYMAVVLFVILSISLFVVKTSAGRTVRRAELGIAVASFFVGLIPALRYQVKSFIAHGTPIFPFRLTVLGLKIGEGYSLQEQPTIFGLDEYSFTGLARATIRGWFIPHRWPYAFFDSRYLGLGLFADIALLSLPLTLRRATVRTRILFASFLFVSYLAKDFWCPRFAYALVLGICLTVGLLFAELLERPRWRPAYFVLLGLTAFHALRPEWDMFRMKDGDVYSRTNISGANSVMRGPFDVMLYPDVNKDFVIVDSPANGFILPLFGRRLTNHVLRSVPSATLGESCSGLGSLESPRGVLVIDDGDKTKACPRKCAIENYGHCFAWQMLR